jgi:peroxiredoxin
MTTNPSISSRIQDFQAAAAARLPAEARAVLAAERADQAGRSTSGVPAAGARMPDGNLLDAHGAPTSLTEARAGRAAVVVFYRGAWCPYCNIVLRAYEEQLLPDLSARDVALIAISPQRPDEALRALKNNELTYPALSDPGNSLAGALNIVTNTGTRARELQAQLGIDVAASNADGTQAIPMPTVVLLDRAGVIRWIDVHPDYTTRTEPSDILQQVAALTDSI